MIRIVLSLLALVAFASDGFGQCVGNSCRSSLSVPTVRTVMVVTTVAPRTACAGVTAVGCSGVQSSGCYGVQAMGCNGAVVTVHSNGLVTQRAGLFGRKVRVVGVIDTMPIAQEAIRQEVAVPKVAACASGCACGCAVTGECNCAKNRTVASLK